MDANTTATVDDKMTSAIISPSERIAELNAVDASISTLLSAASDAINALSQPQLGTERAQQQFTDSTRNYFSTLSSVEVRLRRQVYALEEAGLIPKGDKRDEKTGGILNRDDTSTRKVGGGPLDPSWLNARVNDHVETGKKIELLKKATQLLGNDESVDKSEQSQGDTNDVEMFGDGDSS